MNGERPEVGRQLAGFLEALCELRPIPNEAGDAFVEGRDIPHADVAFLRATVSLRDLLIGLQRYLHVCGLDAPVPGLLVHRGDLAEQELEQRTETAPVWAPPREAPAPTDRPKEPVKRRTRGRI